MLASQISTLEQPEGTTSSDLQHEFADLEIRKNPNTVMLNRDIRDNSRWLHMEKTKD